MSLRPMSSARSVLALRRRRQFSPKSSKPRLCRGRKSSPIGGGPSSNVCDKLEALKSLIPARSGDGDMKPDRLFQETAEYIVLLRNQVAILQRLVEFYGSSEDPTAV